MIQDFIREFFGWLGYLQRGSVIIQIIAFLAAIILEQKFIRKLPGNLKHVWEWVEARKFEKCLGTLESAH